MSAADLESRIEEARNEHQKATDLFRNVRETLQLEENRQSRFDSPFDFTWGLRPPEEGHRPYAYIGLEDGTLSYGFSAFSVRGPGNANIDIMSHQRTVGVVRDGDNTRFGQTFAASLLQTNVDLLEVVRRSGVLSPEIERSLEPYISGIDGRLLSVGGESTIGDDGFTLSAGANVVEIGTTLGTSSADFNNDTTTRVGGSVGVGAGLRTHWDDVDNDGLREIGYGADIPLRDPLGGSIDLTSEDPVRSVLSSRTGAVFRPMPGIPQVNLTEQIVSTVQSWAGDNLEKA